MATMTEILREEMHKALGGEYAARMHGGPWEAGALAAMTRVVTESHDGWEQCLNEIDRLRQTISVKDAQIRTLLLDPPSQLADELKACKEVRDDWANGYVKVRDALRGLVDALGDNDEDGLTEFAPQMQAARAALDN